MSGLKAVQFFFFIFFFLLHSFFLGFNLLHSQKKTFFSFINHSLAAVTISSFILFCFIINYCIIIVFFSLNINESMFNKQIFRIISWSLTKHSWFLCFYDRKKKKKRIRWIWIKVLDILSRKYFYKRDLVGLLTEIPISGFTWMTKEPRKKSLG